MCIYCKIYFKLSVIRRILALFHFKRAQKGSASHQLAVVLQC